MISYTPITNLKYINTKITFEKLCIQLVLDFNYIK